MYKSILVPFDNSDHAKNALQHAITIAEAGDAQVTVLFVADLPDFNDPGYTVAARMAGVAQASSEELDELRQEFFAVAERNLIADTADIVEDFANVQYRVTAGKPQDLVVDIAESEGCDLIVMGCRGLGALRGALGSVSYAVARSVQIPVMLVK